MRRELGALSHALNLNCRFLGEQKQADILPWLAQARVFCGPSITLDDGTSEAFGNVFCEAQAMGVPVVSFRTGGIPETMVEGVTGLLANERDVSEARRTYRALSARRWFLGKSSQAAIAWVRQTFDVKRQTARLETLYDQAIEEFSHRPRARRSSQRLRSNTSLLIQRGGFPGLFRRPHTCTTGARSRLTSSGSLPMLGALCPNGPWTYGRARSISLQGRPLMEQITLFGIGITNCNMREALDGIELSIRERHFSYAVNPNVDHLIKLRKDPDLRINLCARGYGVDGWHAAHMGVAPPDRTP